MTKLLLANTYYQLIFCIQLKNTLLKNDDAVLCVTDHSQNSKFIVNKLSKLGLFRDVFYLETKSIDYDRNKLHRAKDVIAITINGKSRYSLAIRVLDKYKVDKILFYNTGFLLVDALLSFYPKNTQVELAMFEEGILSYNYDFDFFVARKIINKARHLKRQRTIRELTKEFYCFYPQVYKGNQNAIKVPLISLNSPTAQQLCSLFKPDMSSYSRKYIFFTSVYDFEGGAPVGEYELVCKIADLVGKDNLLIKIHPRDARTIYSENGFNVDKNSSIPWEAIQLSGDFSGKVFMTLNSGSVLAGSTMSDKPVKTFYMYKLCNYSGNDSCKKTIDSIEYLLFNDSMKEIMRNVFIAENIEDIL